MRVDVRRIRADEGLRRRAVRLRALANAPTAFGSTLEREEAFADAVWHERAAAGAAGVARVTYVAEDGDRWVGIATGLGDEPDAPGATLVGMFVEPAARGRGVGRTLVEAVADWARSVGATRLHLWVTSTNDAALGLYRRAGFAPTGKKKPLDHTSALTELEMSRAL
jgi:GNAT superfamily N-acetyltransferase